MPGIYRPVSWLATSNTQVSLFASEKFHHILSAQPLILFISVYLLIDVKSGGDALTEICWFFGVFFHEWLRKLVSSCTVGTDVAVRIP